MIGKVLTFPKSSRVLTQTASLTGVELRDRLDSSGQDIVAKWDEQRFRILFGKLNKVFAAAIHQNWDGEGATPVALSTYQLAVELIHLLPVTVPTPEILADNDGYIEFEWYSNGKSFSIYVTGTEIQLYAGYYGSDDRLSGRFSFRGKFPEHLVPLIARVSYGA